MALFIYLFIYVITWSTNEQNCTPSIYTVSTPSGPEFASVFACSVAQLKLHLLAARSDIRIVNRTAANIPTAETEITKNVMILNRNTNRKSNPKFG